ncbi:DUF6603 domain-containing protein [uncultured Tateyamaria sp.]|uniref:DUF6603 domain-containing protein n=1 Tax=uncultured Tateyamaria sp. TaxID=455651 RepID=UPI0026242483|nr:DUF6603 domain-containing protein [uncultured Tateyamaria sp.]
MEKSDTGLEFPADAIDARLKDIGVLVGLLTPAGSNVALNLGWFENPVQYIEAIPANRDAILDLLRDLLGDASGISPDGNAWFQIKYDDTETPVYVVLPKDNDGDSSVVSLGLYHTLSDDGPINASLWAAIPLFELPLTSSIVVTGSASDPITLALDIKTSGTFAFPDGTFNGLEFKGFVTFDNPPSFELDFLGMTPPAPQSTVKTLDGLVAALETLSNWINPMLAQANVAAILGQTIPSTGTTLGAVLVDLGVLKTSATQTVGGYTFGDFKTLQSLGSAKACAEWLLAEGLKVLASRKTPVFKIQEGGVYIVSEDVLDKTATDYGLRVTVPDIHVTAEKKKTPTAPTPAKTGGKKPNVLKLQAGKWLTGESDKNNWIKRSDPKGTSLAPGISLFVVRETGTTPAFKPRLELVSLGLDYNGAEKTPLASVKGVTLGGVEPRFSVSIDFAKVQPVPWGIAMRIDKFGLPVGNVTKGASGNPVAANLLSSGTSPAQKTPAKGQDKGADKQAVAPEFSAALGWVHDPANPTTVNFQLFDQKDKPSDKVILPIQRSFGPLFLKTFGLEWKQPNTDLDLGLLFDAKVTVSKLEVELKGLSVGIPLRTPGTISDYSLGLEGLDFTLQAGSVDISGGLFKDEVIVDGNKIAEYNGQALVKIGDKWTVSAMGSWAEVQGHPSLFVFAMVDATIGGPGFFFVTGVSGGFGYNRALKIPAQDKVQDFPLVAGLTNPAAVGGKGASPAEALAALKDYIPPAQGVNFFAAGVQFTSYELIKSNALLVIEFGKTFEVAVLGLSRIKLPQEGSETFAYVELGLEVLFVPAQGVLGATLQITPNSYVLTKDCKLTGGFAFFVWFDPSPHAGDFVLTVGGYSPYFRKPAWYPDEPRLGFNWKVSDQVTVTGTAYFALTPSAIMGGGGLDIQFHSGAIKAWFTAHADFLIQWKPFAYIIDIGVTIGVSVRVKLLFVTATIKVEVGASLELWGPPTGGEARVHLWVASFTVGFGASKNEIGGYVDWNNFTTLLPQNTPAQTAAIQPMMQAQAASPPFENVVTLKITGGQVPAKDADGAWLVRASAFTFDVETAWPLTQLNLNGPDAATPLAPLTLDPVDPNVPPAPSGSTFPTCARADGYYVGVRPMGINCTSSVLDLSVVHLDTKEVQNLDTDWNWTIAAKSVPEALWGIPIAPGKTPAAEAKVLPGRMTGLSGIGPKKHPMTGPPPIPRANLASDPINPTAADNNLLPLPQDAQTGTPVQNDASLATIAATAAAADVTAQRTSLFDALGAAGVNAGTNADMQPFVDAIPTSFAGAPMLGRVAA